MVIDRARLHVARPAHDEGHTDAPFVARALQPLQLAVAAEESGVCPTLLVRPVVRRKDENGVFVQSALLQLVHDFPDIGVETRNHGRKLRMDVFGGVVATHPAERLVVAELLLVRL